jgi:hypothetical protein
MIEYVDAVLEVGWQGELIVRLGVGDHKVVPSLHLWPRAGQGIGRCSRTVDPMFTVSDVERLCIIWHRSNPFVEDILIFDGNEMESYCRHDGRYVFGEMLVSISYT